MVIKSICAGTALSLFTGAVAVGISMLGASFVLAAFVLFGTPSAYLIGQILPTELFYQLFPEGGGPAFMSLSIVGSLIQLLVIFSVGFYFLWFSRHAR